MFPPPPASQWDQRGQVDLREQRPAQCRLPPDGLSSSDGLSWRWSDQRWTEKWLEVIWWNEDQVAPRWLIVSWLPSDWKGSEIGLSRISDGCEISAASFSGSFRSSEDDTSITNTKKYSTGMKICKYGSTTNMQCQLLVIILNMMKAVKILIRFNRYSLSFLCQKQLSTTYHFFPQICWACQKYSDCSFGGLWDLQLIS